MPRKYTATVTVADYWNEGDPVAGDLQDILDTAFEYVDGHTAKVVGDVTITEDED